MMHPSFIPFLRNELILLSSVENSTEKERKFKEIAAIKISLNFAVFFKSETFYKQPIDRL